MAAFKRRQLRERSGVRMELWGVTERRQHYRLAVSFPVERASLFDVDGDVVASLSATVLEISIGGARLVVNKPIAPGDLIDFAVALGDPPWRLEARALAVHAFQRRRGGSYHVGAHFIDLSSLQERRLSRFISEELAQRVVSAGGARTNSS